LIASQIYIVHAKIVLSPFDDVRRHMSASLYCYTAETWLVFAMVMALATAKATEMGIRTGLATAAAMLTLMATAMATAMATVMAMSMTMVMVRAKAMVIEWQQLATVIMMVMLTA
jgi:hypothetical protein